FEPTNGPSNPRSRGKDLAPMARRLRRARSHTGQGDASDEESLVPRSTPARRRVAALSRAPCSPRRSRAAGLHSGRGRVIMSKTKADCFGASDAGRVRPRNEDQFLIAELQKSMLVNLTSLTPEEHMRLFGPVQGQILLVADGVGGAAAGDRASRIAVSAVTSYVL